MNKNKKKILIRLIVGFIAGVCNGLLGSGGGTIVVPFLTEYLEIKENKAHATAVFIILFLTLVSIFFYGFNSFLDYRLAVIVSIGGIAGGLLGAKLLNIIPSKFISKIFGIFMIAAAIKMVV